MSLFDDDNDVTQLRQSSLLVVPSSATNKIAPPDVLLHADYYLLLSPEHLASLNKHSSLHSGISQIYRHEALLPEANRIVLTVHLILSR